MCRIPNESGHQMREAHARCLLGHAQTSEARKRLQIPNPDDLPRAALQAMKRQSQAKASSECWLQWSQAHPCRRFPDPGLIELGCSISVICTLSGFRRGAEWENLSHSLANGKSSPFLFLALGASPCFICFRGLFRQRVLELRVGVMVHMAVAQN